MINLFTAFEISHTKNILHIKFANEKLANVIKLILVDNLFILQINSF